MAADYEYFKKEIFKLTSIDLNSYKEKQMKRRIDNLITKNKITGYDNYVNALKTDKALFDEFINYITINVSEFYRNPDQWKILEDNVIPALKTRFPGNVKIWSAACSTGDEPYTLAMVFNKQMKPTDYSIYATDIDKQVLGQAANGVYSKKSIAGLPKEYIEKYITATTEHTYKIDSSLKKSIRFEKHNLLLDPFPKNLSLIVCRNVLIYFTEEAKEDLFEKFYESLAPGGILFLGATEQMMNYKQIGYERLASFFFEKPMK